MTIVHHMMDESNLMSTSHQDLSLLTHEHVFSSRSQPSLPTEIWIEIISYLDLADLWFHIRLCCLLFYAISTEIAHRIIRARINNLCSVHDGSTLSLTTSHFHWNGVPNTSTHSSHITWNSLPEDQHPDIFLRAADEIPTSFSLYLPSEMSWTHTLRIVFRRAEIAADGTEKWIADSEGGWEMHYGTIKGPMRRDATSEQALRARRVCPTRCVIPLGGVVRMLLLGPDQSY
jgi:hypothetical protein